MMEKLPKKAVSLVSWLLEVLLNVSYLLAKGSNLSARSASQVVS